MGFQETVTLVNRTTGKATRPLTVTYDGLSITLEPGDNYGFPKEAVPHAKAQNPVMGSQNPNDPFRFKSLVGIKGVDDCSPIKEDPKATERIDRKAMVGIGRTAVKVKGDPASAFEARVQGAIDGLDASQN